LSLLVGVSGPKLIFALSLLEHNHYHYSYQRSKLLVEMVLSQRVDKNQQCFSIVKFQTLVIKV